MAIQIIQTSKELIQRIRTDVQRNLSGSNPFLKNGFLSSFSIAFGNRFYDVYRLINYWKDQFFVQTADEDNIGFWAELKNITQRPASPSSGPIVILGESGTLVDEGTIFTSNNLEYETLTSTQIDEVVQNIQTLTQINGLAIATFSSSHGLATNIEIVIAGADQTEYNGTHVISVISPTQLTFQVDPSAVSPATGTITTTSTRANVNVRCLTSGSITNLSSGAELSIQINTVNVNPTAYVAFGGLTGGTDQESTADYRSNVIDAWKNPVANFNPEQISRQCKTVPGVTRVFVKRITPAIGQVTIYFTRDNDDNIIPSATDVATVKSRLLEIAPADTSEDDIIVSAPTPVSTNFVISDIVPDSNSMREAIENSLDTFFRSSTEEGEDVTSEQYLSVIFNTFDPESGEKLRSYNLTSPTTDIEIDDGEIATLGTVTFS